MRIVRLSCYSLTLTLCAAALAAGSDLPQVLIIGDSISIGYAPIVTGLMAKQADIHRPLNDGGGHLNCEGTTRGVERIDEWLAAGDWKVIHFNFGLHDLKHVHPESGRNSNDPKHPQQADVEQYAKNLEHIVKKLKATGAKLIFATTTPYPDRPGGPLRRADQVEKYNQAAQQIMRRQGIPVNDLHGLVKPRMEELLLPRNVHFRVRGNRVLADQVARVITQALESR